MLGLLDRATKLTIFTRRRTGSIATPVSSGHVRAITSFWPDPRRPKPKQESPAVAAGFFLAPDCGGYFAMRSLASDCPIELNTDKVWLACLTSKNLSAPLAQYFSTVEVGSPPVLT